MSLGAGLIGWKGYAVASIVGAALLGGAILERHWYGASQYRAGADAKQAEIEKRQAAIEHAWQEERDRADAKHRGAVLAREQIESKLAQAERDRDAAFARIAGLRKQLASRGAAATDAGGGSDSPGPDWIGLFGECLGRAQSLGRRLGEVGKDAAGWADQVNGLQGYIQGLRGAQRIKAPEQIP
ncbi:hypothetical protein [Achromobacter spanius]|uniref:DUF2514 family protein n=1 Tax=Achromobacter spanius TaxID=217203 RepID=A0AAW3I5Y6_9BURK|nr:hypothetical protein [Achromobacter spanius]KNE28174.1 hypothetical protein AFM18_08390 [Achromobacter spanius]